MKLLELKNIIDAGNRIAPFIHKTPILSSSTLNKYLRHEVYFKAEGLQKIGAFKIRGGLNTVAWLIESNNKPSHIIANSSGNHAQAVAYASKIFDIPATIYMPKNVSKVKAQATLAYGASIDYSDNRIIADQRVLTASYEKGNYWIPPFNHNEVIAGQGTAAYEAFADLDNVDAVFAPCGGGGLLSGTLVSTRELSLSTKVIGTEPKLANDAIQSVKNGSIFALSSPPGTIADGARTLSVGEITFEYLKQLDDFIEVNEDDIIYWTQWLTHLLKIQIEPTSAMAMAGAFKWLKTQHSKKKLLIILSGANIDKDTMNNIWKDNHLSQIPLL